MKTGYCQARNKQACHWEYQRAPLLRAQTHTVAPRTPFLLPFFSQTPKKGGGGLSRKTNHYLKTLYFEKYFKSKNGLSLKNVFNTSA